MALNNQCLATEKWIKCTIAMQILLSNEILKQYNTDEP